MTIRKIGQMSLAHVNEMPLKWLAQTVRVAVEADAGTDLRFVSQPSRVVASLASGTPRARTSRSIA